MSKSKAMTMTALACLWLFNAGVSASTTTTSISTPTLTNKSKSKSIDSKLLGPRLQLPFPDDKYFHSPLRPVANEILPSHPWYKIRRKQAARGPMAQNTCSMTMTPLCLRGGASTTTIKMEVPTVQESESELESTPAPVVTAEVEEFLSEFDGTARDIAIFSNDELFEETYGFTMRKYLSNKRDLAISLRKAAKQLTKVSKDTGIAQTIGGGTGIFSGLAILGGLGASVVTGGASLAVALAITGTAAGVASAGTSITASVIKAAWGRSEEKKINKLFDDLKSQDKIVVKAISDLTKNIESVEQLAAERDVTEWLKSTWYVGQGTKNGLEFYAHISEVLLARSQWLRSQAQLQLSESLLSGVSGTTSLSELSSSWANQPLPSSLSEVPVSFGSHFTRLQPVPVSQAAKEFVAPGKSLFGKTLVEAGKPTAYVVQGVFAALGIGIGIWDVIDGAAAIKGSDHARAYKNIADKLDKQIKEIEDFRNLLQGQGE